MRADRGQIEQVILNLVVNARDAMPHGGQRAITTRHLKMPGATIPVRVELPPGGYVVLSVQDNGTGMSDTVQARAFDPFFTTKEPGKGTGLGLSTVYGIVTQSGGAVAIDSVLGEGTTAWVCLPAADAPAEPVPLPPAPDHGQVKATVLLAEDDACVRELVQRNLRLAGYLVLTANDGREAQELVQRHPRGIDLVVTDVVMPRMSGRDLAGWLAVHCPGVPVLFMTGYTDQGQEPPATAVAAGHLLQWPFGSSELLQLVAKALALPIG